jgi:hypothetical protein
MRSPPTLLIAALVALAAAATAADDAVADRDSRAFVSGYLFGVASEEISRAATLANLVSSGAIVDDHQRAVWAKVDDALITYLAAKDQVAVKPPIYDVLAKTAKDDQTTALRDVLLLRRRAGVVNADADSEAKIRKLTDEFERK